MEFVYLGKCTILFSASPDISALLITQSTMEILISPHHIPHPFLSLYQLMFCIYFKAQPKCNLLCEL